MAQQQLTRRRFALQSAGLVGCSLAGGHVFAAKARRILVIGGTGFIGPHIVRGLMAAGHKLTLFNRGKTNPDLFAELETVRGDRNTDMSKLAGRSFDAVIDTSGYTQRHLTESTAVLQNVKQYLFVSSISVYDDFSKVGLVESAPRATLADPTVEVINGETYGGLKAICEDVVFDRLNDAALIIRPGLIVGPGDKTDRFTYWPARVARGGQVLAPGDPNDSVQFIDVRDLADWVVRLIDQQTIGAFNAVSPPGFADMGRLLANCRSVAGSDARFVWAHADFLSANNVAPWSDMPVWVPPTGDYLGFASVNVDRAVAAGLRQRPIADTVSGTLDWFRNQRPDGALKAGLAPERESELLAALRAQQAG